MWHPARGRGVVLKGICIDRTAGKSVKGEQVIDVCFCKVP
jgi:hypothetical protein